MIRDRELQSEEVFQRREAEREQKLMEDKRLVQRACREMEKEGLVEWEWVVEDGSGMGRQSRFVKLEIFDQFPKKSPGFYGSRWMLWECPVPVPPGTASRRGTPAAVALGASGGVSGGHSEQAERPSRTAEATANPVG